MIKEIECEGPSVAEAILAGLRKLNIKKEDSEIKIVDEGANGLFGFVGAKPARVRIRPKQAQGERRPSRKEDIMSSEVAGNVESILKELVRLMGLEQMEISVSETGGIIKAEIDGADKKLLIGKNGKTINALQTLLPIMAARGRRDAKIRICVDVGGYLKEKDSHIIELANEAAQEVKTTGKQVYLEPMSSRERMLVHTALTETDGVTTVSEGDGDARRVLIKPSLP